MGLFEQFPYLNFHELNLDWLIQQINLVKESVVLSVNGQTGEVILYPEAFVRLPDLSDTTTWSFYRYADGKAEGVQFINGQPMQRIDDLNRYDIYDSGNPPPYPVTAVNGQTGDVVIAVPVQSVNGQTGEIILYQNASIEFPAINTESWEMWRETPTNQAIGVKFASGQPMKRIDNGIEYTVYDSQNPPPYPVESVAGLTGAVAILNTQIVTDQGQQKIQIVFPVDSVDGQNGSVNTWGYTNNPTTKLPLAAPNDLWNLTRDINSGTVGLRFTYDSVNGALAYLTFNNGTDPETTLRLLTPADIPSTTGVISINGLAGIVNITGDDVPLSANDNTPISTNVIENTANIDALISSYAIVSVGNNHQAISEGQYVYVMDHSVLPDGLYTANTAIPTGGTLTTSNLTAVSAGGLNKLLAAITDLQDKITTKITTIPAADTNGYTANGVSVYRTGNVLEIILNGIVNLPQGGFTNICTLPEEFRPDSTRYNDYIIGTDEIYSNPRTLRIRVEASGLLRLYNYGAALNVPNAHVTSIYII